MPPFDADRVHAQDERVSRPVKTQYGYHVIQPISDVRPPHDDAAQAGEGADRRRTLLEKAKNDAITKWTNDTKNFFAKKVAYATGFAPPAAATSSATTTG